MRNLIAKYEKRLVRDGLAEEGAILLGALDAEEEWNRDAPERALFSPLFQLLPINTLLAARPAEPYGSITACLAREALCSGEGIVRPQDCETRTFLHDLPVLKSRAPEEAADALKRRKGAITADGFVLTTGAVSPEQAYTTFSSICFALFVKFFSDFLQEVKCGGLRKDMLAVFERAAPLVFVPPAENPGPGLMEGPHTGHARAIAAMDQAGKATVGARLVDSCFGNISCRVKDTVLISQTGASLDELLGNVDAVPLDGSSCAGITASSELPAHREIYLCTENRTVLHGHPRFSVILSMDCATKNCPGRGLCHVECPEERFVCGAPVVSGEVGAGPSCLWRTVPRAVAEHGAAIVYGHGVFTVDPLDFRGAFQRLWEVETRCREEYQARVSGRTG
jgi:ribulose-5-phosphate 4-epimerase/fuculose-1-phosphate aldolase